MSIRTGPPAWEVFVRSHRGVSHTHVGTVHAADGELALQGARDLFTRRREGESLWVVRSTDIVSSKPESHEELFDPAEDKSFRHASDYQLPPEVSNM